MWDWSQEKAAREGSVGESRGDSAPQAPGSGYRSGLRSDASPFPCPNLHKLPILALKVGDLNQESACEGTTKEIGARAGAVVPTSGNCCAAATSGHDCSGNATDSRWPCFCRPALYSPPPKAPFANWSSSRAGWRRKPPRAGFAFGSPSSLPYRRRSSIAAWSAGHAICTAGSPRPWPPKSSICPPRIGLLSGRLASS